MCENSWQHAKWYLKDSESWREKRFSSVRDENCTHHARLNQVMPSYSKAWWLGHQAMCLSETFIPWNKQESLAYLNSETVCAAGCYWAAFFVVVFNKKTELRVQSSTIVLLSAYFSTVGKLFHLMWLLVDFLFLCHPDFPTCKAQKTKHSAGVSATYRLILRCWSSPGWQRWRWRRCPQLERDILISPWVYPCRWTQKEGPRETGHREVT